MARAAWRWIAVLTPLAVVVGGWPEPASGSSARADTSQWTVYHGDPQGSGEAATSSSFDTLRRRWTTPPLDGQIYGEPLVDGGRVFVATENDTVYALSASSGAIRWSTHLAPPVPAGDLPCGDISPTVGVTGTPVLDMKRHEIFAVADELVSGQPSHHLVGLDLSSGKVVLDEPVDPPGDDPAALLQRTGLNLDGTALVFGLGGNFGDCGAYHGWVVSVPVRGGPARRFEIDPAPGERQGAVWMGGAAPEVSRGDIWFAAGNGSVTTPHPYDGSDSVNELDHALGVRQRFAPAHWYQDNARDLDLGSTAPALVGRFVVQVGKSGVAYLLRRRSLGGVGGRSATATAVCTGGVADGGNAVSGAVVYLPCQSGLEAVRAGGAGLQVLWHAATRPSGPPIVAGGLVWSIGGTTLYGIDPATGATRDRLSIGNNANHFPTPSAAGGRLFATGGDAGDRVVAFAP